jgi:hypothetical protein
MGAGLAAIGFVDALSLRSPRKLTIFQQKACGAMSAGISCYQKIR